MSGPARGQALHNLDAIIQLAVAKQPASAALPATMR